MKFHTHDKDHDIASTAVTLYCSGVGYSLSLSFYYNILLLIDLSDLVKPVYYYGITRYKVHVVNTYGRQKNSDIYQWTALATH